MAPKSPSQSDPGKLMPTTATIATTTDQTTPRKLLSIQRRILTSHRVPFSFIANGDFSIVWSNVIAFSIGHAVYLYSMYILLFQRDHKTDQSWLFACLIGNLSGLGVTAGAHRLWSHRSYKAKLPLRIFLMICHCIAGQNCLFIWCRDHRVHHKYSETDADPHNSKRGFFFAHVGWLLRKKHPDVKSTAIKLSLDDIKSDPVVQFQSRYYLLLYLFWSIVIPIYLPIKLWNESIIRSFLICFVFRYITSLHSTWFVNSTAHMFGDRPYNKFINPRQNSWVSYGALGEGYHNYHHTFPTDYRTAEDGMKLNATKFFIDFMKITGQAYDCKVVCSTVKS